MRLIAAVLALAFAGASHAQLPPDLRLETVFAAGTFSSPLAVRHAGDGSGRYFVVQRGGVVRVVRDGVLLATPLVSISVPTSGERGLLGLAFHPNYNGSSERRFYLSYTSSASGNPHAIAEFQTQVGNPDVADAGSRREVISVPDLASNHNGGDLQFGPDGYLYWAIGDGGPQGDPHGFAQCLWSKPADNNPSNCSPGAGTNYYLLGKILRIDPTPTTSATAEMCAATPGQPAGYSIPPNNPFVGSSNTCDEIVHYGMRNPWRISFDRLNGDLYVGDVGQGNWEETTRIPFNNFGFNLGWRCFEGTVAYNSTGPCNPTPAVLMPFQTYNHSAGRCSITGGYRYRGPIVALQNTYFSGDACTGEVFYAQFDGTNWTPGVGSVQVFNNNNPSFGFYGLTGFGEDEEGNLYMPNMSNGALYRFTVTLYANGFE